MLHRALRISAQLGNTALHTLVPNEAMPAIVFGAKSNACVQMRSRGHVSRMRATGAAVRVCVCACVRRATTSNTSLSSAAAMLSFAHDSRQDSVTLALVGRQLVF